MTKRVSEGAALPRSQRIKAELESLRHFVDNFNKTPKIALRSAGIGKESFRELDASQIFTTKVDGWEFGYKLEEYPTFFKRKVYVKVIGHKLEEVPENERKEVLTAVFDAVLDRSAISEIEQIAEDCLLIEQSFMPVFLHEHQPGIVVPGNPLSKQKLN